MKKLLADSKMSVIMVEIISKVCRIKLIGSDYKLARWFKFNNLKFETFYRNLVENHNECPIISFSMVFMIRKNRCSF